MIKLLAYDSWRDFIAASRMPSAMSDSARASKSERADFNGCSLADAHKMAEEGWLEGAENARRFSSALCEAIGAQIDRTVINYDVEGHNIDVARYLDNEPECWQKFDVERVQQPAVKYLRVVVNVTASGGISARTIMGRGSVVAALVELLEFAGNRVEVVMAESCSGGGTDLVTLATIKRFDEPIDMPMIAYALAHPSTLRVHHFSLMETQLDSRDRDRLHVGTGYGMPSDVPLEHRGDLYLGRMMYGESQWTDAVSAKQWVREQLKGFGVTLHENVPAQ